VFHLRRLDDLKPRRHAHFAAAARTAAPETLLLTAKQDDSFGPVV
jgi:hypothetical protein